MDLPYLTSTLPGTGGVIRARAEDFEVDEIPAYTASGDGEHHLIAIRKTGLSTFQAIDKIARLVNVNPRDIGFAGLKDARAVTRQHLTVPRASEEALLRIDSPSLTVESAARHHNKLRPGHLKGNRFTIKVRDADDHDLSPANAQPIVDRLAREGIPNYFGEQRFGRRGDNDLLGAALLRGAADDVVKLLIGSPKAGVDPSNIFEARRFFENNDLKAAMHKWPRSSGMERRILARYEKTGSAAGAIKLIEPKLRRLWLSALQSRVFNDVVAARIEALGRVLVGDLAEIHAKGACFSVEDVATEQARADAFEISATGPMLGYRMTLPAGEPLAIEQAVFDTFGLTREDFKRPNRDQAKGDRRAIRVPVTDASVQTGSDEHGEYLSATFTLPAGSFGTVVMREIMKTDAGEAAAE